MEITADAQKINQTAKRSLAFTHVNVIDVIDGKTKKNMTVIITGTHITAVGYKVSVPKNAVVVNATGKYLIPGLWDMHVHVFNNISQRPPNEYFFPLFIANGVTGIRDMWTKTDEMAQVTIWRKQFYEHPGTIPRFGSVGTLVDGPPAIWAHSDTVATPEEARHIVHQIKISGVDFIKTYSNLSRKCYFAIAEEAKKLKIPFAGHVPFVLGADEASNAGQKSMEHSNQILETCSGKEDELLKIPGNDWSIKYDKLMVDTYDKDKALKLFSLFARNKTWQVPTLIRKQTHYFTDDVSYFTKSKRLKYIPVEEQTTWSPYITKQKNLTNDEKKFRPIVWQAYLHLVGDMQQTGVKIMTGTDVGTEYIYAGFSLHDELALLVQGGLTPLEALQASTKNPAEYLGIQDSLGTIEKGKFADLVLLDANPLDDIHNTQKINAVVANGKYLPRSNLDKLLLQAETFANKK